jgi:hypothetical protein
MDLVAQTGCVADCLISLVSEKVEKCGFIVGSHDRQPRCLLADHKSDRPSIEGIALRWPSATATSKGRQAGVHFEDCFALSHQVLSEVATVSPGTFDAPTSITSEVM